MARVLVVDDEIGIRDLLSEILSDEGYEVETAEDAASARRLVEREGFDLILLDIWMPDTDGVTLLKEWASRRQLVNCPVIMMSGHATIDTAVEATRFGALNFLEKPITMQKLLDGVRHGLTVRQRMINMRSFRPEEEQPRQPEQKPAPRPQQLIQMPVPGTDIVIDFNKPLREVRETMEKAYLTVLMNFENCQMTRVAKRAGLERTHLYRKLKALNMEIPRGRDASAPARADDAQEPAETPGS